MNGMRNEQREMLKQIGMGAGAVKGNSTSRRVNFIDKYPITLNMTFKHIFPFAMQLVVIACANFVGDSGQGLFAYNHVHNFEKFINSHPSFSHQLVLLSENLGINWFKHGLIVFVRVIPFKVCNHFFKRMEAQGWYLPPHHGSAFLNGGNSFGVKKLFSGYGITVRGADRTYAVRENTVIVVNCAGFRREGKDNRPRRNFTGNVNGQPVAGGHFYGLCNAHKENIA
jgi:hypothetical protein